jgi:predicted regulator of Ras-like GTPase activity (Roadblock/LC7/MglB family)
MSRTHADVMMNRLQDLQTRTPDVEASAIISVDGLPIASSLPAGAEEDRVAAMSAAMLSLGDRISGELGQGMLEQIYVKGGNGYIVLVDIGGEAVLTVIARANAKLGLVFLEMRRAVEDLQKLVQQ